MSGVFEHNPLIIAAARTALMGAKHLVNSSGTGVQGVSVVPPAADAASAAASEKFLGAIASVSAGIVEGSEALTPLVDSFSSIDSSISATSSDNASAMKATSV